MICQKFVIFISHKRSRVWTRYLQGCISSYHHMCDFFVEFRQPFCRGLHRFSRSLRFPPDMFPSRISNREHIRCKATSPCKLQSGPPDQHSRGMEGLDNFTINRPLLDCVTTLLQIPSHSLYTSPLDVDPVAQIRVCTVCTERLVCI